MITSAFPIFVGSASLSLAVQEAVALSPSDFEEMTTGNVVGDLRRVVSGFHHFSVSDAAVMGMGSFSVRWVREEHVFVTPRQFCFLREVTQTPSRWQTRLGLCIKRLREREPIDSLRFEETLLRQAEKLWNEEGISDFHIEQASRIVDAYESLSGQGAAGFFQSLKTLLDLSEKDFAKRLGISASQCRKYLGGDIQGIEGNIDVMADVLEMQPAALRAYFAEVRDLRGIEGRSGRESNPETEVEERLPAVLPPVLPQIHPANRNLAELIQTVAKEKFAKDLRRFARHAGVDRDRLTDLARGIVLIPGDGKDRKTFEKEFLFYGRLLKTLFDFSVDWEIVMTRHLRAACLHQKGWLQSFFSVFDKKRQGNGLNPADVLKDFFLEMRCQSLLDKSGNAFQNQDQADPCERIVIRFVHWWIFQQGEVPLPPSELGMTKAAFARFLTEGIVPAGGEWIEKSVSTMGQEIREDWAAWRLEDLRRKFDQGLSAERRSGARSRTRSLAWKVVQPVFTKWIGFNGGIIDGRLEEEVKRLFGVSFSVFVNLINGHIPEEEETILSLDRAVGAAGTIVFNWTRLNRIQRR